MNVNFNEWDEEEVPFIVIDCNFGNGTLRLKVGDKVIFQYLYYDFKSTIVRIHNGSIGIEFDEKIVNGHSCGGRGKFGHCRTIGTIKNIRNILDNQINQW